jgi:8-amino-7-oxononanoate synthase
MQDLGARLNDLESRSLLRHRRIVDGPQGAYLNVDGARLLSFCSNDYLGLANAPELAEAATRGVERYGVGAAASALICGHTQAHEALERALAAFVGMPRALYFSTGYMASLGVVPTLVGRGDAVFSDGLNHACLIDAARLSRADVLVYPHRDFDALEQALATSSHVGKLVISDAVFSMDGDIAPVADLVMLCDRYDAWLLLDDAHGFGVLGAGGRGTLAHLGIASPRIVYMGTLGKAAGVFGAFIAGTAELIEWVVQRARTYVFTTASPPMLATALLASLDLIAAGEWRRAKLQALAERLAAGLAGLPWRLLPSRTPIQPLVVGDSGRAVALMEALLERGIWVPAIRPPTVPTDTARLRISLSAAHEPEDITRLIHALHELAAGAAPRRAPADRP